MIVFKWGRAIRKGCPFFLCSVAEQAETTVDSVHIFIKIIHQAT